MTDEQTVERALDWMMENVTKLNACLKGSRGNGSI